MLKAKFDAYKAQFDFQYRMLQGIEAKVGVAEMMEGQFDTAIKNSLLMLPSRRENNQSDPRGGGLEPGDGER